MKTKSLFALTANFLSLTAFLQKNKQQGKTQETVVYAEKKGYD
nr:hypothetical protein [uncultured Chryseobacterium sp.]